MTLSDTKQMNLKILFLTGVNLFNCKKYLQEPFEYFSQQFFKSNISDEFTIVDFPDITISEAFKVPETLATSYLGESLSFILCITNDYLYDIVSQVNIKLDLRTPKFRNTIFREILIDSIPPSSSVNRFVYFELNDLGTHTISSEMMYKKNGEDLNYNKSVSFEVQKPIDIKTKYVSPELLDYLLFEMRIQNISQETFYFNSLCLKSPLNYEVFSLNQKETSLTYELQPKEICSFLYRIHPKQLNFRSRKDIGKLDICWEKKFGNRGRLQTGYLDRPLQSSNPNILITVLQFPTKLRTKVPFNIKFEITNCSTISVHLQLMLSQTKSRIRWCGVSNFMLAELPENQSITINVFAISFASGEHHLALLMLRDKMKNIDYKFDKVLKLHFYK